MIRVYWWFKGVEEPWPGGPWWFRDFDYHEKQAAHFANTLAPHCVTVLVVRGKLPFHWGDIAPPVDAMPWPGNRDSQRAVGGV